jgi:hypothetical protein
MSEHRFVGSAIINGKRERVAFNAEIHGDVGCRAGYEHIFERWCYDHGYWEPELIDWYLA